MISRASLLFAGLLVGAAALPTGFASANSLGSAGGINGRSATVVHTVADSAAVQKQKAAALKKKKLQQQQAAAAAQAKAKAEQEKKKDWYEDDRDRGLDVASKYAPKQIAKVRKENYVAKGDTVSTGNGKKGWQQYMDKYYSR
jgi:biotin carboxyl carrier protein